MMRSTSLLLAIPLILQAGPLMAQAAAETAPRPVTGAANWSPDGRQLVYVSDESGAQQIWVMAADGSDKRRLSDGSGSDSFPSFAPDGGRILFTSDRDGNPEIYTIAVDGSDPSRLTDSPVREGMPSFSSDGTRIWFVRFGDERQVFSMKIDGSDRQRFSPEGWTEIYPVPSPDGDRLAFTGRKVGDTFFQILVTAAEYHAPVNVSQREAPSYNQAWSPDGTRLAFISTISDNILESAIFVVNVDGSGLTQLTYTEVGCFQPRWSPDGTRISFRMGWEEDHVGVFTMNADGTDLLQLTNR